MALLLASSVGAATPEAERTARAHFQAGEARFKAGAFDEALAEYQAGYDVLPLPGFLINVAQCQRRLGDLKTARATYQKFVLVAPDSPLLPQVRSMIAEIDGLLAKPEADKPAASEADEAAKPASTLTASALAETPAPSARPPASPPRRGLRRAAQPAPRRSQSSCSRLRSPLCFREWIDGKPPHHPILRRRRRLRLRLMRSRHSSQPTRSSRRTCRRRELPSLPLSRMFP